MKNTPTQPARKRGRPRNVDKKVNVAQPVENEDFLVVGLHEAVRCAVREYLMDMGVIPPHNEITDSIAYSVSELLKFLSAYDNVVRVLDDIIREQFENRQEINTVMVAKFGIVTKGRGFKLNRQLLHAMIVNGQGEVDISTP